MTVSSSLTPAIAGYNRPTLTRVVFHAEMEMGQWVMGQMGHHFWMGHVGRGSLPVSDPLTGALQPLDRGFGTVCRPGFASPTMTLENFIGS